MNKLLIVAVVLAAAIGTSQAVKCYICNSISYSGCGDTFANDPKFEYDCGASVKGCTKGKANDLVTRACGNVGTSCTDVDVFDISTTTCGCTGDLCNSASYVKFSVAALLAALVVPFLL